MSKGTHFRLDTVDLAVQFGWHVESMPAKDEFTKDGRVVVVEYSQSDEVTNVLGVGNAATGDLRRQSSALTHEGLRDWLAGKASNANATKDVVHSAPRLPKLRWSREGWLHKPTQEVVDDDDPRVPRTIDQSKKQNKTWYMVGSQADVDGGYYRRDIVVETMGAIEPMYTATWHPQEGAAEVLIRGSGSQAYSACVRHYQSSHG